jgi:hypothetical protein
MFQDFFKCNVAGFTGKNNNNGASDASSQESATVD